MYMFGKKACCMSIPSHSPYMGKQHKICTLSLQNSPHPPFSSSILDPNILLSHQSTFFLSDKRYKNIILCILTFSGLCDHTLVCRIHWRKAQHAISLFPYIHLLAYCTKCRKINLLGIFKNSMTYVVISIICKTPL